MNYLGIDIGTTGAKALVVSNEGVVLGSGYSGYQLIADGCKIEQQADDWTTCGMQAVREAIAGLDSSSIAAISLSTQGASTVAIDAQKRPIGNAWTWMDTRSTAQAAALEERLGNQYIYHSTGWRISPAFDAAKIMCMKQNPAMQRAVLFLSTLEYMNFFLTGNPICDPSNASMRQIYNINNRDYDLEILNAAGIDRSEIPDILPTGSLVGHLTHFAADVSGLRPGTPVYNGAHDQYCASLGASAINQGDMLLSAGTTWVVMGIDDKPLFTKTFIAPGVHPISGLYGAIASLVGCGSSLQWFKSGFMDDCFEEINQKAASRAEKTQELYFFPYLSGANYPIWNLKAKGAFSGIGLDHDRYDFARVIMEGSAFSVRSALNDFAANGCRISNLKIMGGAAKSTFWCSLIAAAADVQVEIPNESEICALGAAMIAAYGSGAFDSLQNASTVMAGKTRFEQPDPVLTALLDEKYSRYQRMWSGIAQYYE